MRQSRSTAARGIDTATAPPPPQCDARPSHPAAAHNDPPPLPWTERLRGWIERNRRELTAYLFSTVFNTALLALAGLIVLEPDRLEQIFTVIVRTEPPPEEEQQELVIVEQPEVIEERQIDSTPMEIDTQAVVKDVSQTPIDINDFEPSLNFLDDSDSPAPNVKIDVDSPVGGRSTAAKAALVAQFGGTEASEKAVSSGLKWLARHQNSDGSWSFDHVHTPECGKSCTQPGTLKNRTGATAMALLAFLGAGHTHKKGDYRKEVGGGLNFLMSSMTAERNGPGDLRGQSPGNAGMYIQGLAGIALCEAYALTKDRRLKLASELAVSFIMRAQHPTNGGWRYQVGQEGDTSVVGWQLMALKSAQSAKIPVPGVIFQGVTHFLDLVQTEDGTQYGYTSPAPNRRATTAVGLLCRMYLGWKPTHTSLQGGVARLSAWGPAKNDMYYNYYATQVLHHWGGDEWKTWNAVMREQLVNSQIPTGHAAGSWTPADSHAGPGGRLYMTCMAIMTLEVYYRHLPIYHRENIQVEF